MNDQTKASNESNKHIIVVSIIDPKTGETEQKHTVNHAKEKSRVWMGKLFFWAIRNEKIILTVPLSEADLNLKYHSETAKA